jgi:hypothetical protein
MRVRLCTTASSLVRLTQSIFRPSSPYAQEGGMTPYVSEQFCPYLVFWTVAIFVSKNGVLFAPIEGLEISNSEFRTRILCFRRNCWFFAVFGGTRRLRPYLDPRCANAGQAIDSTMGISPFQGRKVPCPLKGETVSNLAKLEGRDTNFGHGVVHSFTPGIRGGRPGLKL